MAFKEPQIDSIDGNWRFRAFLWYLSALLVLIIGSFIAARQYPGGFDWLYTVASALASQKHNPSGSMWFAGSLVLAMIIMWRYVSFIKERLLPLQPALVVAMGAMRIGLAAGMLLGLERLFVHDLSDWFYKAHEILGLTTFFGLYFGILGLLFRTSRWQKFYVLPVIFVTISLLAIGVIQLLLYFDQRDLGWVDTSWREMGISFWLSFAFWQWLAIGFLFIALGLLSFTSHATDVGQD